MSEAKVTVKDKGTVHERVETRHPSFGLIGISRVSGMTRLFGSSVEHQNYVMLTIQRAYHSRDPNLHCDWIFAEGLPVAEVAVSFNQLSEMLFNSNVGDGVPCTIKGMRGGEYEQTWKEGEPPITESAKQYLDEFEHRMKELASDLKKAVKMAKDAIDDKNFGKGKREELFKEIDRATSQVSRGLPWTLEQFIEKMEQVTTHAKAEIEAMFESKLRQAGVEALQENPMKVLGFDAQRTGGGER